MPTAREFHLDRDDLGRLVSPEAHRPRWQHAAEVLKCLRLNKLWSIRDSAGDIQTVLANEDYWDPAVILRFGRVYETAGAAISNTSRLCGTKASPLWLRLLYSLAEWTADWSRVDPGDSASSESIV